MFNKLLHIFIRTMATMIITINAATAVEYTIPLSIAFADSSPIQITYTKLSEINYLIQFKNTSADDIYGIQSILYGGFNSYGTNTKYIPDLAPGAEVVWAVSFTTPSNGSVSVQTSFGNSSIVQSSTVLY